MMNLCKNSTSGCSPGAPAGARPSRRVATPCPRILTSVEAPPGHRTTLTADPNLPVQVLRMYVSSDCDANFLYSLEVAEPGYARIRDEEQLLVGFPGFAEKVTWLLEQCCSAPGLKGAGVEAAQGQEAASPAAPPAFRAVLHVAGAATGAFRIVERNAFKELPHLTLQTRAGTDASVKQASLFATCRRYPMLHCRH